MSRADGVAPDAVIEAELSGRALRDELVARVLLVRRVSAAAVD